MALCYHPPIAPGTYLAAMIGEKEINVSLANELLGPIATIPAGVFSVRRESLLALILQINLKVYGVRLTNQALRGLNDVFERLKLPFTVGLLQSRRGKECIHC